MSTAEILDEILRDFNPIPSDPSVDVHCTEETQETEESEEIEEREEAKESKEIEEIEEAEEAEEPEETNQEIKETNDLSPDIQERLDEAIYRCGVINNINRSLFTLAREIRGFEGELDKRFSLQLLHQIVERWKSANSSKLKIDHDYQIELIDKLSLVRFPKGRVLVEAHEMAEKQTPPAKLRDFSKDVQTLGCLCRELQRRAGVEPFFLDGRSLAKVLGQPHSTVASWMRALCCIPIIQLVQRGTQGYASRYKYIAQD